MRERLIRPTATPGLETAGGHPAPPRPAADGTWNGQAQLGARRRDLPSVVAALRPWLLCGLLILPATTPYLIHLVVARSQGLSPTGFILADQPYYMANAREYLD